MKSFLKVAVIGTRVICLLIGLAIAASFAFAAFLAATNQQGELFTSSWKIFSKITGIGLILASGFIMFAIGWRARFGSRTFRVINAVLLLLPLTVQVMLIKLHRVPFLPTYAAVITTMFTASLLLLCAKPWLLGRAVARETPESVSQWGT